MGRFRPKFSFHSTRCKAALRLSSLFVIFSAPLLADPIGYTTFSSTSYSPLSGSGAVYMATPSISGNTSIAYTESNQSNGFTLTTSGSAAAERGTLHASASYELSPPSPCSPCTFPTVSPFWGVVSAANWEEHGVTAAQVGPGNTLAGITDFKVTFALDGTFSNSYQGDAAFIGADVFQGATTLSSGNTYFASPANTVTFLIAPPDTSATFDILFHLSARAASLATVPGAPLTGTVDFFNTATLTSIQALDGNGNVLPGVVLESSDGTLLGAATTPTPEPSAFALLGTGILGLVGIAPKIRSKIGIKKSS